MVNALASNPGRLRSHVHFYESARRAMAAYFDALINSGRRPPTVILPAYVGFSAREGSGILDPVMEASLEAVFYDVNLDLSANLESVRRRISDSEPGSALVLVHYFGRTDPGIAEIAHLCRRAGVLLIEDLAHAYFSHVLGSDAGRHGDASVFSLHKMLPLADGGMLSVRNQLRLQSERPELAETLLAHDSIEISRVRRRNFMLLAELVSHAKDKVGWPMQLLWPMLDDKDVPQTLPILLPASMRDDFYRYMNDINVGVVSLYHTLVPELPAGFDSARRISSTITNLPVHQDLNEDDVSRVFEAVELFFQDQT